jgi:Raf kinase inhibitor-like YbhB/YbcL family protein
MISVAVAKFELVSPAFKHNQEIPKKFTCQGQDISPELQWNNAPATAKSFALIVDDPDAPKGTWVHWVLFNIPATVSRLAENATITKDIGISGITDFGTNNYGGPCPPEGHGKHRYFFKLYALDTLLNLPERSTKDAVEKAMNGHIIESAQLIGIYQR